MCKQCCGVLRLVLSALTVFIGLWFSPSANALLAQDVRDHWIFGPRNHIRFTPSGPVNMGLAGLTAREGPAAISDQSGNLLFYGSNEALFNRNHDTLVNGVFHSPCLETDNGSSVTQGGLILPSSQDFQKFYFIHIDGVDSDDCFPYKLHFSSIDMSFDGGLGGVMLGMKKQLLAESAVGEQLTAIRHGNGIDWWVLVRKAHVEGGTIATYTSNAFLVFLASDDSITLMHEQSTSYSSYTGELKASPAGERLALASYNLMPDTLPGGSLLLYDFDRCTGMISNEVVYNDGWGGGGFNSPYGLEFSPSGELLYVATYRSSLFPCNIFQVDLTDSTLSTATNLFYSGYTCSSDIEMGPDGKLYFNAQSCVGSSIGDSLHEYLHCIENPNIPGPGCNVNTFVVPLAGGEFQCFGGVNSFPNYYLGPVPGGCQDTTTVDTTSAVVVPPKPEWNIYPTLAPQLLTVDVSQPGVQMVVWDIMGREVERLRLSEKQQRIPSAAWPTGTYRVILYRDGLHLGAKTVVRP